MSNLWFNFYFYNSVASEILNIAIGSSDKIWIYPYREAFTVQSSLMEAWENGRIQIS